MSRLTFKSVQDMITSASYSIEKTSKGYVVTEGFGAKVSRTFKTLKDVDFWFNYEPESSDEQFSDETYFDAEEQVDGINGDGDKIIAPDCEFDGQPCVTDTEYHQTSKAYWEQDQMPLHAQEYQAKMEELYNQNLNNGYCMGNQCPVGELPEINDLSNVQLTDLRITITEWVNGYLNTDTCKQIIKSELGRPLTIEELSKIGEIARSYPINVNGKLKYCGASMSEPVKDFFSKLPI